MGKRPTTRPPRLKQGQKSAPPLRRPQVDQPATRPNRTIHLLIMAGLCAVILAVYWNALGNGFVADDHPQIIRNGAIQTFSRLTEYVERPMRLAATYRTKVEQSNYRPLFWASLAIDWQLWGLNPSGYHLTNLLLHMANACLLYWLLWTLFSRPLPAFAVSLLWALHPIQTEAVAYVSGRVIAVATYFLLIGLLAWLRATRAAHASARTFWLGIATLSLFLALLSHEIAVTYPLLILLIEWYRARTSPRPQPIFPGRLRWSGAVPLLAPLVTYLAIRMTIAPFGTDVTGGGPLAGFGARLGLVLVTLGMYLRLLLFPVSLSFDWSNSLRPPTTLLDPSIWLAMALLAAAVFVTLRLRASSPAAVFGVGWFALTLLPVSNVVPIYSVFAERYLYLPSIGISIAVIMALGMASERLRKAVPALVTPSVLTILTALLALLYGGRTTLRNRDYRDNLVLATATLAATPESFISRYWWGLHHMNRGEYDLAEEQLLEAVRVKPDLTPAYGSLGELYEETGRDDLAREAYQRAVALEPTNSLAHYKLGLLDQRRGAHEEAYEAFDRAVQRDPRSVPALNALAAATLSKGDLTAARALLERVLALEPTNAVAQANLGALYVKLGKPEQALAAFQAAATADPNLATAHYNLGLLYRRQGQPERAQAAFREAERLDPGLRQGATRREEALKTDH